MNPLIIVLIVGGLFFWGYRFYAKRLESLWQIDRNRATPAYSKYDSVDYVPAKNWLVLFGHHFSSIAGAGPILGPVIAVMLWGWLPAILWVVLGTIFIGGVHDFGSLITSVREGGCSISDIAEQAISKRAKAIFALFILLALILVIAVFAFLCADTFVKQPKIILPSLGLIPVAISVGYLLYSSRVNNLLVTLLGLGCLLSLILLGNYFPIAGSINAWLLVLFIYCYFASVLPVNILLQPRDYLVSFLLFFCVAAGYLSIVLFRLPLTMPYLHAFASTSGSLWPMMFITVACGAVSGFHSLIASGTSSKQIANERYAKRIGYGSMVTEGLLAVLVIICVAAMFGAREDFGGILRDSGPIVIFSKGYGLITGGILGNWGPIVALTILNAFILTTLDTATRIARYVSEELFAIKNRYLSTLFVVIAAAGLGISGKWERVWLVFGASNQLVAALALFVLSAWLLSRKRNIRYTLLPALFMLITTITALVLQAVKYYKDKEALLCFISAVLIALGGFMVFEVASVFGKRRRFRLGKAGNQEKTCLKA